jgi:hypothetical protein
MKLTSDVNWISVSLFIGACMLILAAVWRLCR